MASEWVECSRVLSAAGIDRADVSLLEAGAADTGLSGIDCGHEFEFGEEVSTCVCPARRVPLLACPAVWIAVGLTQL